MTETVGFIGAGQLGQPMVARLLAAGHRVLVYTRRSDISDQLHRLGAHLADSAGEVASQSDLFISCLFSDAQLRDAGLGPNGFAAVQKPDSIFVSHTTGSRSTLAEVARVSRAHTVDAPVSGTADDIMRGKLTVLLGGPEEAVERVTQVISAYADPIIATGSAGTALDIKLINNLLFAANAQLVAAAAALGTELGVDSTRLLAALAVCSGGSKASSHIGRMGGLEAFEAGAGPFLRKDVAACVAAAEEGRIDLGTLRSVVEGGLLALSDTGTQPAVRT
ncbi:MAG: NAD(P)-dependent oxidoreductase [Mycobacterium sp.]